MTGLKALEGHKYPAKEHARRVYKHLESKNKSKAECAFFISGEDHELYPYCDQAKPIRQNRYFYYLTGCDIPGSHVLYVPQDDQLVLYLPNIDYDDVMWSGLPLSLEDAEKKYDVSKVKYASSVAEDLKALSDSTIFTTDINRNNSKLSHHLTENDTDFFYALDEARLIKDWYEIELMRHAAKVTDKCHLAVMSAIPIETNETHIHAEFVYHAIRQGSKEQSYDPICCSGTNCSTLHYVKNDEDIDDTRRTVLLDAGAEWSCYASDVTRCFPINGDWSKEHLEIYKIVQKMQHTTMGLIKPGASWDAIHMTAHKVLIDEFLKLGIFKSEYSPEQILGSKVSSRFFPHGLGHLLGMDTHDVGGHPNYEDPDPLLRYLRLRRPLQKGMVLTDEPGVYFSPFLLDEILKSDISAKYIDRAVLNKYWYVGGVRIEDDLLITDDGFENLTGITSDPAKISEIVKAALKRGKEAYHVIV